MTRPTKCARRLYSENWIFPGRLCESPQWAWSNHMEPLCKQCFRERKVIQNLLIIFSGRGNWGSLIIASNPRWDD